MRKIISVIMVLVICFANFYGVRAAEPQKFDSLPDLGGAKVSSVQRNIRTEGDKFINLTSDKLDAEVQKKLLDSVKKMEFNPIDLSISDIGASEYVLYLKLADGSVFHVSPGEEYVLMIYDAVSISGMPVYAVSAYGDINMADEFSDIMAPVVEKWMEDHTTPEATQAPEYAVPELVHFEKVYYADISGNWRYGFEEWGICRYKKSDDDAWEYGAYFMYNGEYAITKEFSDNEFRWQNYIICWGDDFEYLDAKSDEPYYSIRVEIDNNYDVTSMEIEAHESNMIFDINMSTYSSTGSLKNLPGFNFSITDSVLAATPSPAAEQKATVTPSPTAEPKVTVTPLPTAEPKVTVTPSPTAEPKVTVTPSPTAEPKTTATPLPTEEPTQEVKEAEAENQNSDNEYIGLADSLNEMGLFAGTEKGYELDLPFTREQGATMIVRLLGAEKKVLMREFDYPEVFVDVTSERWSFPYVMYCYDNGITKGTGTDTFTPEEYMTAEQYISFVLRVLGYVDAAPENAYEYAKEKGLISSQKAEELKAGESFLRGDMVHISYNALKTNNLKGKKLADELVYAGVITQQQADMLNE